MRKKIDCRRVDDFDLEDKYCSVAAAVVGSAVVGGVMQGKAASKAANAQESGANQANETQRYMYDTTRQDNAPFLQTGTAANKKLAYFLGIGGTQPGSYTSNDLIDTSGGDWRANAELYASSPEYKNAWDNFSRTHQKEYGVDANFNRGSDIDSATNQIKALFNVDDYNKQQLAAQGSGPSQYGSLLRSFGASDLASDPIYQSTFQNALDQGNKGINQIGAASGSQLSGNTLKALSRFGANTAATYGNDAYNRFNTNQSNVYNRLAGVSGSGQVASGQVGAAGQNMANQVSQNQIGLGNARGASAIAQGNAFNNALSTGVNAYQQNQYMNSLNQSNPYSGTGYSNQDVSGLQEYQGLY